MAVVMAHPDDRHRAVELELASEALGGFADRSGVATREIARRLLGYESDGRGRLLPIGTHHECDRRISVIPATDARRQVLGLDAEPLHLALDRLDRVLGILGTVLDRGVALLLFVADQLDSPVLGD